ncbi:MAG: DNA polymerase III subunit alpha [Patescibacteria group bacterium]|nr:DNA polymerase III subunit alpha [Patescibacteria group bacterium]MDE1946138.1 DNA polymerase III subunit alpha [Patescibacteria group bacterium]
MPAKFIHLHAHSHYSLLGALPKVKELVKAAKTDGMDALALTDAGALYGAIEFYQACKKEGVKPLVGVDFYVAARTRNDKQAGLDNRRTRLVLLAKNLAGYKNLIKLVTYSFLEGFYYKPRIDRDLLEKYSDDLVCIMPHFSGEISMALRNGDTAKAKETAEWYKKIFDDDFFLEITHHPEMDGQIEMKEQIKKFAKESKMNLVAAHDVYYLKPGDKSARDTLVAVNSHSDFADRTERENEDDFSFITQAQAAEYFKDEPDALANTEKIAAMCNLDIVLGKDAWVFPRFVVESGLSQDEELKRLAYEGIAKRGLKQTKELVDRIEYELKIIRDKKYPQYFLVVADLLRYAAEHGIYFNIRGSVAGSMVTYLTGITKVDPFIYNLPFERFLNPERPSAPDIDMDFADNRRDEVIDYVRGKYGADNVAQIGTFGTMMARGSVRDVTRALGFPIATGDRIAKLIPMGSQGFPMTIEHALETVPELAELYEKDADTKTILDMAKKIEGCARHISVHAAGVVIAPEPLVNYVPLQYDVKDGDKIITQYDMHSVGEDGVGLLKFDFLGIRNLSILADAVKRVEKIEKTNLDIEKIPLDDKRTFDMLSRGETAAVFQLNGSGMTKALKELRPTTIHDINVMVALYRPGPMDNIYEYIARKHGEKKVSFLHPKMKNYLDTTFGVLVYQDDLLMTAIEVAGYSWGDADKFRKAVGKKIPEEMAKQHVKFVEGCVKHGDMTEKKAEDLWKLFEPFQGYGFNKAHAASYGLVSYQTAYMKANFPAIYMSAVLSAESGDVEKVGELVADSKRMGIPVLPPSVNESFSDFTVVKTPGVLPLDEGPDRDKIRFGLMTIKNFGSDISDEIIKNRKEKGKFKTLSDFLERITGKNMNKRSLEALIRAGALDEFADRGVMLANLETMLEYNKESAKQNGNQDSLFGVFAGVGGEGLRLADARTASMNEKLAWEKELLGLYISGHPLEKFREKIDRQPITVKKIKEETATVRGDIDSGKPVVGIIEESRMVMTKNNEPMAFLKIADFTGSIEAVVFPKTYAQFKNLLNPDTCIAAICKVSERNGEMSLIIERLKELQ